MTDQLLSDLRATLARAEALATEMVAVLSGAPVGGPPAECRIPYAGWAVAYKTTSASTVRVGDWVQRRNGDPDWHLVEDVEEVPWGPGSGIWVRITHDGIAHDYRATDAIRVARPPADVVARQELREAGR